MGAVAGEALLGSWTSIVLGFSELRVRGLIPRGRGGKGRRTVDVRPTVMCESEVRDCCGLPLGRLSVPGDLRFCRRGHNVFEGLVRLPDIRLPVKSPSPVDLLTLGFLLALKISKSFEGFVRGVHGGVGT